ncbi:MAG TPA: methionyl-tRNA formyltransferase [Candidatus Binataceae bacterium]|nr:methionyl-tRNA formyltransferase [Candidatus Binataceae bacterium]
MLIGQAAFAEQALATLHQRGEQIVHVFAPPDSPGGRPDPLKVKAQSLGLPLSQPASFRDAAALDQFKALEADLAILAFVTIIVPERILYSPRYTSICFHPSLLPRHRGASAINWAIIEGDTETGVTWFWPDKGIDTGPILIQRRVPIGPEDSTGSIYFNKISPLGIATMIEAIGQIEAGTAPRLPQDESLATYEPPCRDEHAAIDFGKPANVIYNLVRGCDPQPGAYAKLGETRIRLYDVGLELVPADSAAPGTVTSIDDGGMRIAAKGGGIKVKRVRIEPSTKKAAPHELGSELRAGMRLI